MVFSLKLFKTFFLILIFQHTVALAQTTGAPPSEFLSLLAEEFQHARLVLNAPGEWLMFVKGGQARDLLELTPLPGDPRQTQVLRESILKAMAAKTSAEMVAQIKMIPMPFSKPAVIVTGVVSSFAIAVGGVYSLDRYLNAEGERKVHEAKAELFTSQLTSSIDPRVYSENLNSIQKYLINFKTNPAPADQLPKVQQAK